MAVTLETRMALPTKGAAYYLVRSGGPGGPAPFRHAKQRRPRPSSSRIARPCWERETLSCRTRRTYPPAEQDALPRGDVRVQGLPGMEQPDLAKRPTRIILVRHGESEGNVDESVYMRKADSKICLTERGKEQARQARHLPFRVPAWLLPRARPDSVLAGSFAAPPGLMTYLPASLACGRRLQAGKKIASLIGDDNVYFYVSPYRRAQQTLFEIGMQLPGERILGVREDARLREQDFGNFQDEQMSSFKEARKRFSRFFFRFRDGESAADVYDRVTTFRETLRNDINFGRFGMGGESNRGTTVVMVTHGLTLRIFLMRWYKWTVDMFEKVLNPGNSQILVMGQGSGGRYSLAVHHSVEELLELGLTQQMIDDQVWQSEAEPGAFNTSWPTSGMSFFTDFAAKEQRRLEAEYSGEVSGDFVLPDVPMSPSDVEEHFFGRPSASHQNPPPGTAPGNGTNGKRQPYRKSNGFRTDANGNLPI